MNVLFILGNGFDKAQGLATSYQEFYNDYLKLTPSSEIEARLKKEIQSDYETWADLEEGLGKYSAQFDDIISFREVIHILNSRLKDYLKKEALQIDTMSLSQKKLIHDLINPDSGLELKQSSDYQSFLSSFDGNHVYVNVVSLNYTDTFETVFDQHDPFLGYLGADKRHVFYSGILHLHGSLDEMILVGLNDSSQIANEKFRDDLYLMEEFIKPEINRGCENMKNELFSKLINGANVIVLSGVSVGITDLIWWKAIGDRLNNPHDTLRIIYYPYDLKKNTDVFPSRKLRWSKDFIGFLKERMGIQATVDDLRNRIYVGINKPFLKLK